MGKKCTGEDKECTMWQIKKKNVKRKYSTFVVNRKNMKKNGQSMLTEWKIRTTETCCCKNQKDVVILEDHSIDDFTLICRCWECSQVFIHTLTYS